MHVAAPPIRDQVALVSGANTGMDVATTRALLDAGYRVAATELHTEQVSAERQAELRQKIPVGRFCEPGEFAHCGLFLAHPLSGFVTGEVLDLNGGLQFD